MRNSVPFEDAPFLGWLMGAPSLANSVCHGGIRQTKSGSLEESAARADSQARWPRGRAGCLVELPHDRALYEVMAQIQASSERTDGKRSDPPTIDRKADVPVFIE